MHATNRRTFLSEVGRGMFAAGLGTALAGELGLAPAHAGAEESLSLGEHAPLVDLMRSTPPAKLQPLLASLLTKGETDLRKLTAAGALANAVTFGGCDYVGFHTAMALLPALEMSQQLSSARQPLPVLKVLYRNAQQIQQVGGASAAELQAIAAADLAAEGDLGVQIRDACRARDVKRGEALLARADDALAAFNLLQPAVQDDLNVHRFVFAHRTYGLARLLGADHSYTMLRQCVRFCADHERRRVASNQPESPIRALLPKLLDQYQLVGKSLGTRDPGDAEVDALARSIFDKPRQAAAETVAAALADGLSPEVIGEVLSLASNLWVLRQSTGRLHGDSAGVHSSDATNAWRNMLRTADKRFTASGLIVAAYHVGVQTAPTQAAAFPTDAHRELVKVQDADRLLAEAEDAIRHNDQGRSAAAIQIYGERQFAVEPVFALMLKYATSEDGRLHGEKYYHTVREEYAATRPAFRWRQIVGLARVTASSYGYNREDKHGFRAAGYDEACKLLGVEA